MPRRDMEYPGRKAIITHRLCHRALDPSGRLDTQHANPLERIGWPAMIVDAFIGPRSKSSVADEDVEKLAEAKTRKSVQLTPFRLLD